MATQILFKDALTERAVLILPVALSDLVSFIDRHQAPITPNLRIVASLGRHRLFYWWALLLK